MSTLAWGQAPEEPARRAVPDFDARDQVAARDAAIDQQTPVKNLVEQRQAEIISFLVSTDQANPGTRVTPNRHGIPRMFYRDGQALTAPSGLDPEVIAKDFWEFRVCSG